MNSAHIVAWGRIEGKVHSSARYRRIFQKPSAAQWQSRKQVRLSSNRDYSIVPRDASSVSGSESKADANNKLEWLSAAASRELPVSASVHARCVASGDRSTRVS